MRAGGGGGVNLTRLLEVGQVGHGHLRGMPPICEHDDGHFQCSFNERNREPSFVKRPLNGDLADPASPRSPVVVVGAGGRT